MHFIVEVIILLLLSYLIYRVKNWADIDDACDKEYETAKGKNLATKEDIEEITMQIERVKSEISFESQQKKEFVVERKKHLLNILYYVEKILYAQTRLFLYGRNHNDASKLYMLNDELNSCLLEMTHESHVILAEFYGLDGIDSLTKLVDDATILVAEIVYVSHNLANAISGYQMFLKQAEKDPQAINHAKITFQQIEKYQNEPIKNREIVEKDINEYIVWLNGLFDKGLNFNYKLPNPISGNLMTCDV